MAPHYYYDYDYYYYYYYYYSHYHVVLLSANQLQKSSWPVWLPLGAVNQRFNFLIIIIIIINMSIINFHLFKSINAFSCTKLWPELFCVMEVKYDSLRMKRAQNCDEMRWSSCARQWDRKRNEYMLRELQITPVLSYIRQYQNHWFQNVKGKDPKGTPNG